MKKRESIIYDNYNLHNKYDDTKQFLLDEYAEQYPDGDVPDGDVWDEIYRDDQIEWGDELARLENFFDDHGFWLVRGVVERWNGKRAGGMVFDDFKKMLYTVGKDCDYFKLWDENGHFYIKCSHHDGTNIFEVKRINQKAHDFIYQWEHDWNDPRAESEIHDIVWKSNFLSSLPHYAREVYGV